MKAGKAEKAGKAGKAVEAGKAAKAGMAELCDYPLDNWHKMQRIVLSFATLDSNHNR